MVTPRPAYVFICGSKPERCPAAIAIRGCVAAGIVDEDTECGHPPQYWSALMNEQQRFAHPRHGSAGRLSIWCPARRRPDRGLRRSP